MKPLWYEMWLCTTISEDGDVSLGGQVVPKKDTFRYLGSIYWEMVILMKMLAIGSKRGGWNGVKYRESYVKRVPQKLKGKFYRTAIRPAMLYGTECWPTKRRHIQQLSVAEMRMLRWICGHTRLERVRNDDTTRSSANWRKDYSTPVEMVWACTPETPRCTDAQRYHKTGQ
jgi:hypothetical protein